MITLKINSNNGFLNLKDLPHNCIFNKVITGCGGTTIALTNNENYIIAVPTTELIVNKTNRTDSGTSTVNGKDVFGLFGLFTDKVKKELADYIKNNSIIKILCTYDKLPYLIDFIKPEEHRLLIDEYHTFLKAYSYRSKAIDGVLNNFKKFKSFCFMSATPIQAEFKPNCLEGIEEIVAEWLDTERLFVKLEQTNKPYIKVANIINAYKTDGYITINGKKSYEAFFFLNSVTHIAAILKHCDLKDNEVKIVCADNEKNRNTLNGYTISNSRNENKKFTFITSKSFEGADYFSETGICIVVSNASNNNTLLGIDTDIPQIAGRIRTKTNPFRNMLIHVYSNTKLNLDVSYQEMKERTNKLLKSANEIAETFNNLSSNAKDLASKLAINNAYMSYDEENKCYIVNDLLPKLELYNYQLNQAIYNNGIALTKAYNKNNIRTTEVEFEDLTDTIKKASNKISFKEAFLKYAELTKKLYFSLEETEHITKIHPLIVPAYHKLGEEKVKALRYTQTKIKDALMALDSDKDNDNKIARILKDKIGIGFNSCNDIIRHLTEIYSMLGITEKVKSTAIGKWYDVEPTTKRIDGKVTKGYNVFRAKFLF